MQSERNLKPCGEKSWHKSCSKEKIKGIQNESLQKSFTLGSLTLKTVERYPPAHKNHFESWGFFVVVVTSLNLEKKNKKNKPTITRSVSVGCACITVNLFNLIKCQSQPNIQPALLTVSLERRASFTKLASCCFKEAPKWWFIFPPGTVRYTLVNSYRAKCCRFSIKGPGCSLEIERDKK